MGVRDGGPAALVVTVPVPSTLRCWVLLRPVLGEHSMPVVWSGSRGSWVSASVPMPWRRECIHRAGLPLCGCPSGQSGPDQPLCLLYQWGWEILCTPAFNSAGFSAASPKPRSRLGSSAQHPFVLGCCSVSCNLSEPLHPQASWHHGHLHHHGLAWVSIFEGCLF